MPTLRAMIAHHADPVGSTAAWTPDMAQLPDVPWLAAADFAIREDRAEMARQAAAISKKSVDLSDQDISDLEAFLHALTGATALTRPLGRPEQVPSGIPVD